MINKIKSLKNRLRKSKDGKTLASNFGYLMLLQIAGYIFPLMTLPYLARVIGVEGFGEIALAIAVIIWFQTITDWGFNYTATRDLAQNRDNPEKVSEIFSNVLWSKLVLGLVSFIILCLLISYVPFLNAHRTILLLTFLLIPGNILFADWFFQAIEKMRFITIFSLISKIIFTIFVFLFIKEKEDFILQPLFISLGSISVGLISFYIIVVKWKVKIKYPNFILIKETIRNSTDVFINNIVHNLYNSFSSVLVGFYGGIASNGILDAGTRFVNISNQFMNIISRVFFPYLSRKSDKHNVYAKINLSLAAIASLVLFIFSPLIIELFFTSEFHEAILVLRIMSLSLIFIALNNVYGVNYMIIKGHEKELRNITIVMSLIGFVAAFPLIYTYGFIGAAINITAVRGVMGVLIMRRANQLKEE